MTPEHPDITEARGAKIDFDYYTREIEKLVLGMS